jgi:hypothetical protein
MEKYDAELDRLSREALKDARRMNQERQADPSREHAWVQANAALEFVNLINDARERFRNPNDEK